MTTAIAKCKPQPEEIIRRLDSLSEKNLNRVIPVISPLIEDPLSGIIKY